MSNKIVYVSIGNSDNGLPQFRWSDFCFRTHSLFNSMPDSVIPHGAWYSESSAPWQNACWCIEIQDAHSERVIRQRLHKLAKDYGQESIAWAEVKDTEFLGPEDGDD